jgi:putative ABC transport system substrate-binding protein
MLRRNFLQMMSGTVLVWPAVARADTKNKVWRVAYLYPGSLSNPADHAIFDVFRMEMKHLGYVEGQNLIIDDRSADGRLERLPALVAELIGLHPDVIVAITTPAIAAAQRATTTLPIVMAPATDPIGSGFVKSFPHPGGNITGMANLTGDSVGKAIELLHSIVPSARRIAVLTSNNPTHPEQYRLAEIAAKTLAISAIRISAPTPDDLETAFGTMTRESCDALFVLGDFTRPTIPVLAAKAKLPAVYQSSAFMPLGALASYHPKTEAIYIKVAQYVDRIFKGANPADYPVEQPVVFELGVNLKTAAALGVTIPDSVLARADRVIE